MSEKKVGPSWETYGLDQAIVEKWVRSRLGDKLFDNKEEQGIRVLEKAIELFQVVARDPKLAREKAHKLVDAVFGKPKGDLGPEVGGLLVTMLAFCAAHELRMDWLAQIEIGRIMEKNVEQVRSRQEAKADLGLAERPE